MMFNLFIIIAISAAATADVSHIIRPQNILQYQQLQQFSQQQRQQQQQQQQQQQSLNLQQLKHNDNNADNDGSDDDGVEPLIVVERLELMELPIQFGGLKDTLTSNQPFSSETAINMKFFSSLLNAAKLDEMNNNNNNNENNNNYNYNNNYNNNNNRDKNKPSLNYEILRSEQVTTTTTEMPIKISAALTALEKTITEISKRDNMSVSSSAYAASSTTKTANSRNSSKSANKGLLRGSVTGPLQVQLLRQQHLLNTIDQTKASSTYGSTHEPLMPIIVGEASAHNQPAHYDMVTDKLRRLRVTV